MKLDQAYDRLAFQEFLDDFLPGYAKDTRIVESNSSLFDSAVQLGGSADLDLLVFEISLDASIEKRIAITTDAFKLMKQYQAYRALIVFHTANDSQWRFSLMTSTPTIVEGKVLTKLSNPRRLSYLLGESAKVVTPHKYLIKCGKVVDFTDLQKRFSVEVVNNEFYKEISQLYDELVGVDNKQPQLKYPLDGDALHQFAVRLIGRSVFCWFLREKRSIAGNSLISPEVLSAEAATQDRFYQTVMAPLFFEVLNKPIEKRPPKFQEGMFGKIPYLNGGLFSPQYDDFYKFDAVTLEDANGKVLVPDEWLRKFFNLLETYHFTVDENTSVDIDLSIDPEMLGRIFENLLARINPDTGETVRKSTGSFYTPREIVEYMVDESLLYHLSFSTGISEEKLRALISYDVNDDRRHPLENNEQLQIVKSLSNVKILDPACGSGAFPIGILQKIVYILQRIDPDAKVWFDNQIANTPPEVKKLIVREFEHKNFDYIRKLGIIRESIFGIDIQPIATEIARLRCFLTLIVDERVSDKEPNRGVYPLPNLDFKFVTANTLLKLNLPRLNSENQAGLFEDQSGIDELKTLRDEYFNSHNSERDSIKLQFSQAQNRMLQNMIANHSHGFSDVTQKLSTWDPFSHAPTEWFDSEWMFGISEGFDIVIGNPPYFVYQGHMKDEIPTLKANELYKKAQGGKLNAYKLFLAFAPSVLKDNGITAFIFQNSFLGDNSAKKIRQYYLNSQTILTIDSFPERDNIQKRVFESVKMSVCIMLARNTLPDKEVFSLAVWEDKLRSNGYSVDYSPDELLLYDPVSTPIPYLKQNEKSIFTKCFKESCKDVISCFEGELNMTFHKSYFTDDSTLPKIIKGAQVQRYHLTDKMSQGIVEYVDQKKYLNNNKGAKSTHHKRPRIAMQGITGVDDKRRFVMALVPAGQFCANSCNYIIVNNPDYDEKLILAIFNSNLVNWIFKKTSTNSNVNCYEVENIPIPKIVGKESIVERIIGLAKELIELYEKAGNDKKSNSILDHESKIDGLVYSLYELSDAEIQIIEGKLDE